MPRVAAKDREAFVEARREEIMEAALRLWSERGYDATPMEAVAREVGLTKGTLYLYFDSKLALLDAVVRRFSLRPDVEYLVEHLRDLPLEEVVPFIVERVWKRLDERRDLVNVLMRELPGHPDKARHFLEQVVIPTNRLFAAYLEEKLGPEAAGRINSVVATRSLLGMVLVFFISQEVLGAGEFLPVPQEEITRTIAEVFLRGVTG